MQNGRVYWITGLVNSGKTTVGNALFYELRNRGHNVVILDGDLMKQITSGSTFVGYEKDDRLIRAKRYSLISKMLADQGIWVIVCSVSMFDEIRDWNRKNISGYIEVYLEVNEDILRERDRKGIYKHESYIQLPKSPDIKIINDGTVPLSAIVKQISSFKPLYEDNFDRDRIYWNNFYGQLNEELREPSDFAVEINKKLSRGSNIIELGCGNGRDSIYFLSEGHKVVAIDGSDAAINKLNKMICNTNALFVCDDFVKCRSLYQMQYDCVYSRFTLHAINNEQENELIINIREALLSGGMLCIEARTIHDDIYGKGVKVGHNEYLYNNHYRRFIDPIEFSEKLLEAGFIIDYLEEKRGFSKINNSDPILMRVIAHVDNTNPNYVYML